MKNITFAITFMSFLVFPIRGICQDAAYYFNKLYACSPCSMLSVAGLPIDDGFLIYNSYNGPAGYTGENIRKINEIGEEQWNITLDGGYYFSASTLGNSMIKTADNHFACAFSKGENDTDFTLAAFKFTIDGILLWSKHYQHLGYIDGNPQVVALPDGGLLLAGWTYEWATEKSWFYTIRTDSQGQELWRKKYAQGNSNTLLHAAATPDGGFVLSGYTYLPESNYDMLLIKIDSLGEVQWQRTYGTPQQDSGCIVVPYTNNSYLSASLTLNKYTNIARLDSVGNIIWEHTFNTLYGSAGVTTPMKILPNGIVATIVADRISNSPSGEYVLWLMKYDGEGNVVLQTKINDAIPTASDNVIRDLEPTPDGGFLLTGFTYSPENSWVLKVDSLGKTCSYIGCDSVVVAQPTAVVAALPVQAEHTVTLMPNPTAGKLHYRLSPSVAVTDKLALAFYTTIGNCLYTLPIENAEGSINLPANLPNGIYLCRLTANAKTLHTQKLVVWR